MTWALEPFDGDCPVTGDEFGAWHPMSETELQYAGQPVPGARGLVATVADEVVGVAAAATWEARTELDRWASCSLAVAPHARRRGIGSALLDGLLAMGLPEIRFLAVDPATGGPLLQGRGFEPLDFGDAHYLHDLGTAVAPDGDFLHVAVAPDQLRDQVVALGHQYNADTKMPDDFDVFEGFADPAHGFLTLGLDDGEVWGVGVTAALAAPGWGASQRLLVAPAHRGRGRGVQLKLGQLQGSKQRGWRWDFCGSHGVDHPASRANARSGGRLITGTRWRQA